MPGFSRVSCRAVARTGKAADRASGRKRIGPPWACDEHLAQGGQASKGAKPREVLGLTASCWVVGACFKRRVTPLGARLCRACAATLYVLARCCIDEDDDPQAARQQPAAVAALAQRCFVPVTVVLELEWVTRGFYELPRPDLSRVLRALARITHVALEDRDAVLAAVEAFDDGLDFAGALHLARSRRASGFATFDRRLANRAKGLATLPPVTLLA